jgi:hypothetical protein
MVCLTVGLADDTYKKRTWTHGRKARGDHGLPKVSPGPAIPYPSTPCPAGDLLPSSTPLETPRRSPMKRLYD